MVAEQISERICEQIADVHGPQVVERTIGVAKISESRSRLWSASLTFQFRRSWRNWYRRLNVPQVQFYDKVDDMTVVMRRLVPMVQPVQKTMEVLPLQFIDKVVDIPVAALRQIHMNRDVQKTMEIHQLQFLDKASDAPAVLVVSAGRGGEFRSHSCRSLRKSL